MRNNIKLKFALIFFLLLSSCSLFALSTTWFYNTLDKEKQGFYMQIEKAILNTEEKITNVKYDSDECLRLFSGYLDDHPGIFWVKPAIGYSTYFEDEEIKHSISFQYTHTDNLAADQRQFIKLVNSFSNHLQNEPNDWFKLYRIYDYLASTIQYSVDYMDQSMWSVFFNGIGVCAGFARSFQYLALLEGIPAVVVHGYGRNADGSRSDVGHLWVMAELDGKWYHFDPTWGVKDKNGVVDYTNFCRSQQMIERTHIINSKDYPIPPSYDDSLSYFNMLKLKVDSYSPDRYIKLVTNTLSKGKNSCTVEFASQAILDKTVDVFFKQKKIGSVLYDLGYRFSSYSYSVNDQALTLKVTFFK